MRQIDHAHQPEDERETAGNEEVNGACGQTVQGV
jgi:hypothetical protein